MNEEFANSLRAIVGFDWVDIGTDIGLPIIDGVLPSMRVCPATAEEVASILHLCAQSGVAVIPTGAGSALDLGNIPRKADILLSTRRLNKTIQYNSADMTVSTQAGVGLAELQEVLGREGQFLPIDPPNAHDATIGGVIATAASGPRRTGYGAVRDLLIGIRLAHPDGQLTSAGGMVVKNVTGYDMGKLYTGSLGTLGVIVEANFKLLPLPAVEETIVGFFQECPSSSAAIDALIDSVLIPNSVEILDATAASIVLGDSITADRTILVRFGGRHEAVARQISDTRTMFLECGAQTQGFSGEQQTDVWQALARLNKYPSDFRAARCRASVLSSKVEVVFAKAKAISSETNLNVAIWGRAFDGLIHVVFCGDGDRRLADAIGSLRAELNAISGSLIVEACSVEVKQQIDIWGSTADPGAVRIMKAIKHKFDPQDIMNPGRFAHGI